MEDGLSYIRATVSYDGTDFLGFQWQPQGRTVQAVLEAAVARVTQTQARVVGSGRTDAGVHARGQVVGFRVAWSHSLPDLLRALNAVLPPDVGVIRLSVAAPGWHPRFSATERHYRYSVLNQPLRSPLDRRYAHHVAEPLALPPLQQAADALVGEHDFASFGRPTQGENTVRRVMSARWQQDGPWFTFDIVGNAFLRGMVRSVTGTLLKIGTGAWAVTELSRILDGRDRALAAAPAPACGLCLMRVEYQPEIMQAGGRTEHPAPVFRASEE
jgi:tRNA pseudouridine38-40 synthase